MVPGKPRPAGDFSVVATRAQRIDTQVVHGATYERRQLAAVIAIYARCTTTITDRARTVIDRLPFVGRDRKERLPEPPEPVEHSNVDETDDEFVFDNHGFPSQVVDRNRPENHVLTTRSRPWVVVYSEWMKHCPPMTCLVVIYEPGKTMMPDQIRGYGWNSELTQYDGDRDIAVRYVTDNDLPVTDRDQQTSS